MYKISQGHLVLTSVFQIILEIWIDYGRLLINYHDYKYHILFIFVQKKIAPLNWILSQKICIRHHVLLALKYQCILWWDTRAATVQVLYPTPLFSSEIQVFVRWCCGLLKHHTFASKQSITKLNGSGVVHN